MSALILLADTLQLVVSSTDPRPTDAEVKPGPMMAVIVLGIVAASIFLWFSLRKQLGRIQVPREGADAEGEARTPDGQDRPAEPPVS